MDKKYYFLAGLHRSGNTVLSSILNQHPEIYSSPLGPINQVISECHRIRSDQMALYTADKHRFSYMMSKLIDNYYYDVEKPIIIERYKNWIGPVNLEMIKTYITPNPKIIFTTRPILEILASYIAIYKDGLIDSMVSRGFPQNNKLTINENIADYLMSSWSNFGQVRERSFMSIDNPDNSGMIHIVKYNDLIEYPQKTMNEIYEFLNVNYYDHDFENIERIDKYDTDLFALPKDLHTIRKSLGKSNLKIEDYLTQYTIDKYKDARYF